jgi:hypothetical protein
LHSLKLNFLQEQLEQGKFTQEHGLEWIILELKRVGVLNFHTLIPNFLDKPAKTFLLEVLIKKSFSKKKKSSKESRKN